MRHERDRIERGLLGPLPYASIGDGPPLLVLAGLLPRTGVDGDTLVRTVVSGLGALSRRHRLVVVNRRPDLPRGMTMSDLAQEHADALQALHDGPVDVLGTSTGGSIAQQLAADHPTLVRRLVLVSTACRLGPSTRQAQASMAQSLRAGRFGEAVRRATVAMLPRWTGRPLLGRVAGLAAGPIIGGTREADDLATTIEAEDGFDLRACDPITAPTLLVVGARDLLYPAELFTETAELIEDCSVEVVPRRGHATVLSGARGPARIAAFLSPA